jgi:hypothetical protein
MYFELADIVSLSDGFLERYSRGSPKGRFEEFHDIPSGAVAESPQQSSEYQSSAMRDKLSF